MVIIASKTVNIILQVLFAIQGNIQTPSTITFNEDGSWVESVGSEPSPKKLAEIKKARELKQKKTEEEAYEEQRQIKNYLFLII